MKHPRNNEYSSFAYYAYGTKDPLITPAPSFLQLAPTAKRRQAAYLAMVEEILKNDWKEKKPYSSTCFIGNPKWVTWQSRQLKEARKAQYEDWQTRHYNRFTGSSP